MGKVFNTLIISDGCTIVYTCSIQLHSFIKSFLSCLSDVDLYRLYRVVDRLGGHTRVTNKSLWKQVGRKLGFENTWSINQVRK